MSELKRDDFINEITEARGGTYAEAKEIYLLFLDIMKRNLADGKTIKFSKLGTLYSVESPPRKYRDFKTGEIKVAPAKKHLRLKTSDSFERILNEK